MQDIPFFTTESGVASLTLREIPYKGCAYIRIQDAAEPKMLLDEAVSFCRAAGAERVFATGHVFLDTCTFHTEIWKMSRSREGLSQTNATLIPVQEKTLEAWRNIYNTHMRAVPNSATMTLSDARKILGKGNGYFAYNGDTLLGIGIAAEECVEAIISVVPGAGKDVMLALNQALSGQQISVELASANTRAVRLYESLGFAKIEVLARWYRIV